MPLTEHLRELRQRLVFTLVTITVIAVALFWPAQYAILWLKNEYLGPTIDLNAFSPTDVIFTEFKFSLYGAIILGLPVIVYQTWMFVVPAFHRSATITAHADHPPLGFVGLTARTGMETEKAS